jgi:AcrR family transcriptional regulator
MKNTKKHLAKGEARDHILEVAGRLFYNVGIRAIGVDTIVAEAGVAKTTLYDHFPSKDHLITAYLEGRDVAFWEFFEQSMAQHPDDPHQQLLDIFDRLEMMISSEQSLGCPFLNAAAEFPDVEQPAHQIVIAHKQKVRERFAKIAQTLGIAHYEQLGDQLLLLLDGGFASKRVFRTAQSPALQMKASAQMLLNVHLSAS